MVLICFTSSSKRSVNGPTNHIEAELGQLASKVQVELNLKCDASDPRASKDACILSINVMVVYRACVAQQRLHLRLDHCYS
jgi:hypothetical protein